MLVYWLLKVQTHSNYKTIEVVRYKFCGLNGRKNYEEPETPKGMAAEAEKRAQVSDHLGWSKSQDRINKENLRRNKMNEKSTGRRCCRSCFRIRRSRADDNRMRMSPTYLQ